MNTEETGISIVMPCLNEETTIGICITKALTFLRRYNMPGEVVIADNGSTDQSVAIALNGGARVVNIKDKGYGSALRGGIAAAKYEFVVMGDADDSYNFLELDGFVEKLLEGYELVMGNRFLGGIEPGAMSFSHKYIGNPLLSGIGRMFFKTSIRDFHCGLRAFRKSSIEKLDLCTTGMEFASEMVVKAVLFGLRITEIPCKLYPDGRNRAPHLRSIPDGLRHLEFLLIYSPRWLFAYPGIILMVIGLVLSIALYIQPIQIGHIQFESTTMFYCAMVMLIGFQMLQFAMFTNIFGRRIGQLPNNNGFVNNMADFIRNKGYWISLILILVGMFGIVFSFVSWGKIGFGQLNTTMVCRTAILFGSLFAMGMEMLLFTIFSRVLSMGGKGVLE